MNERIIYDTHTKQHILTIPASGACPTNKPRLTKYMATAIKLRDMLIHVTARTHLSPESRSFLSTVVVTDAKVTAEKIDSAIQTGKRAADMSRLRSSSTRVVGVAMMDVVGVSVGMESEQYGANGGETLPMRC
jgi:hypothetical protein